MTSLTNPECRPEPELEQVFAFWNTAACGTDLVASRKGTAQFYEEFRKFRYFSEWHIPEYVPFAETRGKSVLEIGCGNGADGTMFALAGARYTGVDLTDTAIEATRRHFEVLELKGKFQKENAESLSFANDSFDFVYSHGVLHHTQWPERAFTEVYRVLKPGGRAVLMLYHKRSFNYVVRIMLYMRVRILARMLLRALHTSADQPTSQLNRLELRGNENPDIWRAHDENVIRYGLKYLRAKNFVHHATDGPECPFAHVYTKSMARVLFRDFASVQTRCAHFPLRKSRFTAWMPLRVERFLASKLGWYLFIYLTK